ncbi:hypothetical protein GRI44_12445 [Altererythrobacter confluentis]|uniref:Uncharacterized protein n=1 Tax=Allopontixanthobacter confluentis TaxID=1849021 RepID=A0A6L7GLN9_9SPHN|nr:hypothetical protein [Allopontixanthobacter confluentis]MXP15561.1 hypothetical protein [Allopontixanthobacter confluentis]
MRSILMASAAGLAMIAAPALAQDTGADGESSVEVDLRYANNIDTSVTTDVTYNKNVALGGAVSLTGVVNVDSSAVAVTDAKQLQQGVQVTYHEENELNGENGFVDPVFGPGVSEYGQDPADGLPDGVVQPQIRVGFFAPIINTVETFDVEGSGNIGVNLAAGYFNDQMNAASIAVSSNSDPDAVGGWAEASTTSLQSQLGVAQFRAEDTLEEDDINNFRDRNTVAGATITGSGNIGVNAAAGSLNQQANLMTLAVANNTTLSEANAGLIQATTMSFVEQQDSINVISGLSIAGASGNIGVNMASGVGNQQLNSLTIAASQGGAAPGNGNGGNGGNGGGS